MFLIVAAILVTVPPSALTECPKGFEDFGEKHTACLPPNPKCNISERGVSDEEIIEILNYHNKIRADATKEFEAYNICPVTWSDELAFVAQKWAEQCQERGHDKDENKKTHTYEKIGQNRADGSGICKASWTKWALAPWAGEKPLFDPTKADPFQPDLKAAHYTQMIWANTCEIGCGFISTASCQAIYVCNYATKGNYKGLAIFKKGKCPNNDKDVDEGVCAKCTSEGLCERKKKPTGPLDP